MYKKAPAIEEVFGSKGKIKILNLLSKFGELNITAIARKTKLNHTRAKIHLESLKSMEIIIEKRFGRIVIYKINDNWEVGKRINKFLFEWNNLYEQNA